MHRESRYEPPPPPKSESLINVFSSNFHEFVSASYKRLLLEWQLFLIVFFHISVRAGEHRYGAEAWATTGGSSSSSKPFGSSGGGSSRPESWLPPDRKAEMNPWGRSQPPQSDRLVSALFIACSRYF